ncbi:unnamed protein product [Closterium sp. Yama58-4]|nr:unnamed protein product [Closterium sp. Yama58-4]
MRRHLSGFFLLSACTVRFSLTTSPCFNPPPLIRIPLSWTAVSIPGFRAFPWTGISILVKDHLKLGPAAAQLMTSTAYMPWSVKPLYGILSDCVPIRGGRRIPYIIIANALSLLSWLALAFVPRLAASPTPFTLLLVLQNVGAAMADVVIDAMVAEAAKGDKERYAGDLQSLSWFSMAAGGVVGSLLGGPALKTLQPHGMFALFAFFPLSQLAMCLMSSERKLTGGTGSGEEDEGVDEEEEEGVEEEERKGREGEGVRESGKGAEAREGDGKERSGVSGGTAATPSYFQTEQASEGTCGSAADSTVTDDCVTNGAGAGAGPHGGNRMNSGSESEESGELGEWEKVASEQQEEGGVESEGKARGCDLLGPSRGVSDDMSQEAVGAREKVGEEGKDGDEVGGGKEEGGGKTSAAGGQSTGLRQRRGKEGGEGGGGKGDTSEMGGVEGAEEARRRRSEETRRSRRKGAGGLGRKVLNLVTALWHAVMSPDIFWPMAWFMSSCAVVPTLSSSLFYFHTNHLHLDPSFLGSTKVIGWAGLMLGTLLYNTRLKYVPIRRIFMWVHISMALCTIADTLLTSRLNLRLGIPDTVFLLGSAAVSDAVNQFKFMPFLVLSARLCPPGIEGTLFALFMSAYNFGNTLSGYMGATLATRLGITATSFDNLTLGVTIQAACTLLPILFLRCVPANMTGVGDEGKQAVRVVEDQRDEKKGVRKPKESKRLKRA